MATGDVHLFNPFQGYHLRKEVLKRYRAIREHCPEMYRAIGKLLRVGIHSLPADYEFARSPGFTKVVACRILEFLEYDPIGAELSEYKHSQVDVREVGQALLEEFEERLSLKRIQVSSKERTWMYRLLLCNLFVNCMQDLTERKHISEEACRSDWVAGLVLVQDFEHAGTGSMRVSSFRRTLELGYHAPGSAMLVVDHGSILDQRTYGMANIENEWIVSPHTVFDIASISKAFTAFCILCLEMEGRISLQQPLGSLVPELSFVSGEITVENLVYHTSGLPEYFHLLRLQGKPYAGLRNADVIATLVGHGELDFEPGAAARYSNSNYMLLSEIVSRVSGMSFADYLKKQVVVPLGLTHTYVFTGIHAVSQEQLAQGYDRVGPHFTPVPAGSLTTGGGNIRSSLRDLALWYSAILGGRFVDNDTYERIFTPGKLKSGEEIAYGFGWFLGEWEGIQYAFHTGYDFCVGITVLVPDLRLAMIFLSNDRSRENIRRLVGRAVIQSWLEHGVLGDLEEL